MWVRVWGWTCGGGVGGWGMKLRVDSSPPSHRFVGGGGLRLAIANDLRLGRDEEARQRGWWRGFGWWVG